MLSSGLGGGKLKIKVLYPTHGRDPLRSGPSRDAHRLPGPGCGCAHAANTAREPRKSAGVHEVYPQTRCSLTRRT